MAWKNCHYVLRVNRLGSKSAVPQLSDNIKELNVEIVDIIQPSTMSIVLQVKLQQEERHPSNPTMILKIYDRQYSPELREFKHSGPATAETEDEFIAFLRRGCMPQFLLDYEEDGPWAYDEWDTPKREAYFNARSSLSHEIELDVYDNLVDMQGIHIPTLFADARLSPQYAVMQQDEGLTEYAEIRAVLMEHISGFPLHDIVEETPESDWASICNQAVDTIRKIAENNFINFDIKTRNILVRRAEEESSYQVFYLDFGECRFRGPFDSDEVWRERKRQKNEEGAVGYMMMNAISFAKGKKGKKYKGTLPLPWQYEPSERFDGEYIELYGNVE
ncbi:hypothetical protein D6C95_03398 [Aureobasidium pullulans]|nr:hypothetical protein D6C95_03398 [Aureobasidium pullulans]